MIARRLKLAGRIRSELKDIEEVVKRVPRAWSKAEETGDELYFDSVALGLHGFYTGLERIFELIAQEIDETLPLGDRWHQELLRQMASSIPKTRPRVISERTRDLLDEYRGFRHVVRNVYAFVLSPSRMKHLVESMDDVFRRVKEDFLSFADCLETER